MALQWTKRKQKPASVGVLPAHVAFIMDGNGRWAKKRGLPRTEGHRVGAAALRGMIEGCARLGIAYMTVYAFSTENWSRPQSEVDALMGMIAEYFIKNGPELVENGIQVRFLGNLQALPQRARKACEDLRAMTAHLNRMTLNIALNYGGRAEIAKAARELAQLACRGDVDPASIDETAVEAHLYTSGQPDVDLLVRTGGEFRLSGFLLYQCSYAEIMVTDTYWPDFGMAEFQKMLHKYAQRDRRFGNVR